MKLINSCLMMILIATSAYSSGIQADTSGIFRYDTARMLPVDIQLVVPDGQTVLLSFYTKGDNGLRLLENDFTDSQGYYGGELQLPIHLSEVTLVVKSENRQDTYILAVNNTIAYAE
ncbi:MAG: hypothetical protein QX196_06570 [Methylococcaceae bacterium]